jgi:hypothetical protein
MPEFLFDDVIVADDSPELQMHLADAHARKLRPLCMCLSQGVPMYVARAGKGYSIKRMPNSGRRHGADCTSYEPPPEASGLGQVQGVAIQESTEDGTTALKFDFSLSRQGGRAAPSASGDLSDTVRTDGAKLTLRATLHYLWDKAGLNRWAPGMAGKRSWYVVRSRILEAASHCTTKGESLGDLLYVPEPFVLDQALQLRQRRSARLATLNSSGKTRKFMIVVGEVKEIGPSRFGFKLTAKHLPDFPLMLDEDIHRRFAKRFERELAMWSGMDNSHLMFIATISMGPTGLVSIESMAAMVVNSNWLPLEDLYEAQLLEALVGQRRRFVKGMRYNLPESRPLACAIVSDVPLLPEGVALYISKPGTDENESAALSDLIDASNLPHWIWRADEEMPALPHATGVAAVRAHSQRQHQG